MNLLLNTDADYATGWHGYDYIVNRSPNGNVTTIEKYGADGTYSFESVGEAAINYSGNEMTISVPKNLVNVSGDKFTVDFKFADNIPEEDDIMLFIDKGDVAPNNRFNYRYNFDIDYDGSEGISPVVIAIIAGGVVVVAVAVIIIITLHKKDNKKEEAVQEAQ